MFIFCILVAASEGRTWNADILKNSGQDMSVLRSSLSNNAHQDQIGKKLCCKLYHKLTNKLLMYKDYVF